MVRWIMISVSVLQTVCCYSQAIIPRFESGDALTIQQLWDIEIDCPVNPANTFFLSWNICEKDGSVLMEAKSKTFNINGTKYLFIEDQATNSPYHYNFTDNDWRKKCEKTGSIIPSGVYTINYTLYRTSPGCNWTGIITAQLTYPLQIQYFNSLNLVYPFNFDTLIETNPMFKWLPLIPASAGSYNNIEYFITVTEVLLGQIPEHSIIYNPAIYYETVANTYTPYPVYSRKLEPGKTYAWQVKAMDNKNVVAVSELWVFSVYMQKPDEIDDNEPPVFLTLRSEPAPDKWVYVEGNYLYFTIETEKNVSKNVNYSIYDAQKNNSVVISGKKQPITITYGKNLYSLPVQKLKKGNKYSLEVKTDSETRYLNFIKK